MRAPFRIGVPALAALLVNGAMLAALLSLGMGQSAPRRREAALTMIDLAVLKGAEDGADDAGAAEPPAPPDMAAPAPPARAVPVLAPPPPMPAPAPIRVAAAPPVAATSVASPPAASPASATMPAAAAAAAAPAPAVATATVRHGARDGLDANAPAGAGRSYAARVRSWLLAHRQYPRHARMRHEEGVVGVVFVIDRAGRLIDGRVRAPCGLAALDGEAAAMLHRASPFPAAPGDLPGERFEISAPIEFLLPNG